MNYWIALPLAAAFVALAAYGYLSHRAYRKNLTDEERAEEDDYMRRW